MRNSPEKWHVSCFLSFHHCVCLFTASVPGLFWSGWLVISKEQFAPQGLLEREGLRSRWEDGWATGRLSVGEPCPLSITGRSCVQWRAGRSFDWGESPVAGEHHQATWFWHCPFWVLIHFTSCAYRMLEFERCCPKWKEFPERTGIFRIPGCTKYWAGQKVHSSLSMSCHGKLKQTCPCGGRCGAKVDTYKEA